MIFFLLISIIVRRIILPSQFDTVCENDHQKAISYQYCKATRFFTSSSSKQHCEQSIDNPFFTNCNGEESRYCPRGWFPDSLNELGMYTTFPPLLPLDLLPPLYYPGCILKTLLILFLFCHASFYGCTTTSSTPFNPQHS